MELSLEDSFQLLSTMSPKHCKKSNISHKKKYNTVLSLRKSLRKSIGFDKLQPTIKNVDIVSSYESSSSSSAHSNKDYGNNEIKIVRPSLDKDVKSENNYLPPAKYKSIQNWVLEVQNRKLDSKLDSTDISIISSIQGDFKSSKPSNSTLLNDKKYVNVETFFKTKKDKCKEKAEKIEASVIIIDDSSDEEKENKKNNKCIKHNKNKMEDTPSKSKEEKYKDFKTPIKEDINSNLEEYEAILDDLYGDEWRKNKEAILPSSEPRTKRAPVVMKPLQTEIKPKRNQQKSHNNFINSPNLKSKNLLNTLRTAHFNAMLESPQVDKLKTLCDPDSNSSKMKNEAEIKDKIKLKLDFDDCTDDNNKGDILPKPELRDAVRTLKTLQTEIKPKKNQQNLRNNFVNSPNLKSKNLTTPRINANLKSPWVDKLKTLCDSDTNSSENEVDVKDKVKSKLDFKDCSDYSPKHINSRTDQNTKCDVKTIYRDRKNSFSIDSEDSSLSDSTFSHSPPLKNKNNLKLSEPVDTLKSLKFFPKKGKDWGLSNENKCISDIAKTNIKPYTFLESLSKSVPISKADPSARIFRSAFKVHCNELVKRLFTMFNEKIFNNCIPENAPFEWNSRLTGTAAYCVCQKVTHTSGIVDRKVKFVLSTKVLDSPDRVRDTLVHEMCHAATWLVNKISDGHGQYWKAWANKAMKTFPELPPIQRCHSYNINTKYTYRCVSCGYSFGRHSKSLNLDTKRCGYCRGKFEVLLNQRTKVGDESLVVKKKSEAKGFSLFVKENYALYKKPTLKHGEVMKVLGEKFREIKLNLK